MATPSDSASFAIPGLPASATVQSETSSASSRKRRASGLPAAVVISDFEKLVLKGVHVVDGDNLPDHVQQFRAKTWSPDPPSENDLHEFRKNMTKWIESIVGGNESEITTTLESLLFPEFPQLLRRKQKDFTSDALKHSLAKYPIPNPRPDIIYGYSSSPEQRLYAIDNAETLLGAQLLQTTNDLLCGSFAIEFKCQSSGGNTYQGFGRVTASLAACIIAFRTVYHKLSAMGIPCDAFKAPVLPGIIVDEYGAHEVIAWTEGDDVINVAIVALHSLRLGEGRENLLRRLKGIYNWLQGGQSLAVEELIKTLARLEPVPAQQAGAVV